MSSQYLGTVFVHTDVASCSNAAIRNKIQVQRFLLPDGVHQHQCLEQKLRKLSKSHHELNV